MLCGVVEACLCFFSSYTVHMLWVSGVEVNRIFYANAQQLSRLEAPSSTRDMASLFPNNLVIHLHVTLATAGEVVNVFFAILIGSLSLVQAAPTLQGSSIFVICPGLL